MSARRQKMVELREAFMREFGPAHRLDSQNRVTFDHALDELIGAALDLGAEAAQLPTVEELLKRAGELAGMPFQPEMLGVTGEPRVVAPRVSEVVDTITRMRAGGLLPGGEPAPIVAVADQLAGAELEPGCDVCGAPAIFIVAGGDFCSAHVPRSGLHVPVGNVGGRVGCLTFEPADRDIGISAAAENQLDDELDYSEDYDPGE